MKKKLPEWPPKDWRSFVALLASVGGGAVAFILAWRVMTFLASSRWYRDGMTPLQLFDLVKLQLGSMEIMAKGSLALMGLSIIGLWFVLGKRNLDLELWKLKLKAGGGEDEEAPTQSPTVTTTTVVTPGTSDHSDEPK